MIACTISFDGRPRKISAGHAVFFRGPYFAVIVLSREIIRNRTGRTVYAAFMDIKKAYPSVWRDGLWWKLWRMGVRGKMWRVLKKMNE